MASEEHESNVQRIEGSGPKSVDCNTEIKKDLSNLCDINDDKKGANKAPASDSVKASPKDNNEQIKNEAD